MRKKVILINIDIGLQRLGHQRIAGSACTNPEQVVKYMGAIQAQDYMQAMWAIGLRTETSTLADVEQAITNRRIVLTWTQRGTIHAVHRNHVRDHVKLTAPRQLRQARTRQAQLGLDEHIIGRSRQIIREALQGGKPVQRTQLLTRLDEEGIRTDNQRGYHILWHCAHEGHICFGPMSGKQQTFVWLDDWIPPCDEEDPEFDASLAAIYFTSHGPATVQDFAWWSGLTLTAARVALEKSSSLLRSVCRAGDTYYDAAPSHAVETLREAAPIVRLLPGFDEYILGYKDRSAILRPEHAQLVVPGNNGVFQPTIVMDGQVAGLWKRVIKPKGVELLFHPFQPLDELETAITNEGRRYAAFMGLSILSEKFNSLF